jgi:hypothetical protein
MTEELEFDSMQEKPNIQIGSEAHPASCPMDTRGSLPVVSHGKGVKLTIHLHLVPRLSMAELYLHSPLCVHGVVLN